MHQNTAIHLNVIEKPPRIKGSLPLSRFDRNAPESALSEMFVVDHALRDVSTTISDATINGSTFHIRFKCGVEDRNQRVELFNGQSGHGA
jgi:hypothetical protein